MERNHSIVMMFVDDGKAAACKAFCIVSFVESQVNKIAVHSEYTGKRLFFGPVDGIGVAKPLILQHFLPLKEHRNSWRGKGNCGGQSTSFPCVPSVWMLSVDLGGNACFTIGNFIV